MPYSPSAVARGRYEKGVSSDRHAILPRRPRRLPPLPMNIIKVVKKYLRENPWPEEPVRLGPGSCGVKSCRRQHAYAEAVGRVDMFSGIVHYSFVFDRPCNQHERVWPKPLRDKVFAQEVGNNV